MRWSFFDSESPLSWETSTFKTYHPEDSRYSGSRIIECGGASSRDTPGTRHGNEDRTLLLNYSVHELLSDSTDVTDSTYMEQIPLEQVSR